MQIISKLITTTLCSVFIALPVYAQKIPDSFKGQWVSAATDRNEKNLCKKNNTVEDDSAFQYKFNIKTNTIEISGWEYQGKIKIQNIKTSSPTTLSGKGKLTIQDYEGTHTSNTDVNFYIKNGRLFSTHFQEDRPKKYGMYHCM